jgi:hypothetical protein
MLFSPYAYRGIAMGQTLFKDSESIENIAKLIVVRFITKYPKWKQQISISGHEPSDRKIIDPISREWEKHLQSLNPEAIKKSLEWFLGDKNKKFVDYPPSPQSFIKAVEHFYALMDTKAKEKKISRRRGLKYWKTVELLATDQPVPEQYSVFKEEAKGDIDMFKRVSHTTYLRCGHSPTFRSKKP